MTRLEGERSMRRFIAFISALTLALLFGCDAQPSKSEVASTASALAAHDATLKGRFATSGVNDRFVDDPQGGAIARAWSVATKTHGMTFGARLPARANGPIDLGLATTDEIRSAAPSDFALRLTHEELNDAPRANDEGRAVYQDVAASTDLLVHASDASVEWFYFLRDEAAPTHFALRADLPKGIARARTKHDGTIAFDDARGKTRLSIPKAFLVDARGVRRDVAITWSAIDARTGRLDVRFDVRGLAFPLLVDPVVSFPLWEQLGIGTSGAGPIARENQAMAYDAARKTTVLFGGDTSAYTIGDTWEWDGTTWTEMTPPNAPTARNYAAMAFDSVRARVVLFGGNNFSGALNDTWEWDGTSWAQRGSATAPSPRSTAAFAYDSARAKTVLFGGIDNDSHVVGDTWTWDGTSWTLASTTGPSARQLASSAYDTTRQKMVVFGGQNASNTPLADTWEWDGTSWTQRTGGGAPSARTGAQMAYDSAHGATVLFGGAVSGGDPYPSDTWLWNGTTWTSPTPANAPSGRSNGTMVFDTARGVAVLFGGVDDGEIFLDNDTWEWNGTTWTERVSTSLPAVRQMVAMAYDQTRSTTVLFGGYDEANAALGDTWLWNGTSWTAPTLATEPSARFGGSLAFDSAHSVAVLFGGYDSNYTPSAETWTWDGTSWTLHHPSTSPPARSSAAMSYDSGRAKTVLFGGDANYTFYNDTWEWNGTTWTSRGTSAISKRTSSALTYDSVRAKTILFGGATSNYDALGDTWEWDGTSWTQRTPASAPAARYQAGLAYDVVRARTILFGGTDTVFDRFDDTWEWDGTTWSSSAPVAPPGRSAHGMVYETNRGVLAFGGYGTNSSLLNDTWLYVTIGAACTTNATCDSGSCVDGVCCAVSACGPCQSCALPGSEGECTNVAAGTVPATGDANACASPNVCSASGVCTAILGASCASADECESGFCADGVCCDSACTGDCQACSTSRGLTANGTCAFAPSPVGGRTACANDFVCNGKDPACPTTCANDATCAVGFYCAANGTCAPQKSDQATCNDAAGSDCLTAGCRECAVGNCVDDKCCATCQGTNAIGVACTNDAQCVSNHCIGGNCCNDVCPAATSDAGGDTTCTVGICPATTNYTCVLPSNTACREASCTMGTQTFVAVCDGKGGCGELQTKTCSPFVCGTTECKTQCDADTDCIAGASCNTSSKQCEIGATCSSDGTTLVSSVGMMTSCSPYTCQADKCATSCSSIKDCASGFTCNTSGVCAAGATSTTGGNGCSCRVTGAGSDRDGVAVIGFLALALVRRRKRATARG